jgi:hypothetical protein
VLSPLSSEGREHANQPSQQGQHGQQCSTAMEGWEWDDGRPTSSPIMPCTHTQSPVRPSAVADTLMSTLSSHTTHLVCIRGGNNERRDVTPARRRPKQRPQRSQPVPRAGRARAPPDPSCTLSSAGANGLPPQGQQRKGSGHARGGCRAQHVFSFFFEGRSFSWAGLS